MSGAMMADRARTRQEARAVHTEERVRLAVLIVLGAVALVVFAFLDLFFVGFNYGYLFQAGATMPGELWWPLCIPALVGVVFIAAARIRVVAHILFGTVGLLTVIVIGSTLSALYLDPLAVFALVAVLPVIFYYAVRMWLAWKRNTVAESVTGAAMAEPVADSPSLLTDSASPVPPPEPR